jgi:hydrogenase maturation protein HypF
MGLLYQADGQSVFERADLPTVAAFAKPELATLKTMLERRVNSPLTTSAGRLFDGVASLIGLRQKTAFEGQAAMELEFALDGIATNEAYPFPIVGDDPAGREGLTPESSSFSSSSSNTSITNRPHPPLQTQSMEAPVISFHKPLLLDWSPMLKALISDFKNGTAVGLLSARFHNALVEVILAVAKHFGQERVVMSGGSFQNRYLTEQAVCCLHGAGFRPYCHQRVPPNDGGIALGQVIAAWRQLR